MENSLFWEKCDFLREARGLQWVEVCEVIGLPKSTVSSAKALNRDMDIVFVAKMAGALNVAVEYFAPNNEPTIALPDVDSYFYLTDDVNGFFWSKVSLLRAQNRYSWNEIANGASIPSSTLATAKRNSYPMRLLYVSAIADFFKCPIDSLLTDKFEKAAEDRDVFCESLKEPEPAYSLDSLSPEEQKLLFQLLGKLGAKN